MARQTTQRGFTLTEMLVALMILLFGLTAIAGSMMAGVSTRRGTEMRFRAIHMVDHVYRYLEEDYFLAHDPADGPLPNIGTVRPPAELDIAEIDIAAIGSPEDAPQGSADQVAAPAAPPGEVPDFPGMKYTVEFLADPQRPLVVLAIVRISWRDQGEQVAERFDRILIRETPFSRRIAKLKGSTPQ